LYVERDGKPGVWFLSLDAANGLAVWAARRFFHLPYWRARMSLTADAEGYRFRSTRRAGGVRFEAGYQPVSEQLHPQPGSLEAFLVERYCLYAKSACGQLYRGEVHHVPWPLHRAEADMRAEELLKTHGLTVEARAPVLHYSPGVEVVLWPFEQLT
jgi:uncharacterized protein